MNEHEKAAFAEIAHTADIQLDEDLLLEHVLNDRELNDVLEQYNEYRGDIVKRLARVAGGDWSEDHFHHSRLEIALDAIRLRYLLADTHMLRIRKALLLNP